jgi:hypothetical protein
MVTIDSERFAFTAEALLGWLIKWLTWLIWLTSTSMADSPTTLLYPCDLADTSEAGPKIFVDVACHDRMVHAIIWHICVSYRKRKSFFRRVTTNVVASWHQPILASPNWPGSVFAIALV